MTQLQPEAFNGKTTAYYKKTVIIIYLKVKKA